MPDEHRRRQVTDAIASGRLPAHPPSKSWGGYGSGAVCAVCRRQITRDQLEAEFQDGTLGQPYQLHLTCLAAWEAVTETADGSAIPGLSVAVADRYSSGGVLFNGKERT
jgi:hypothetical protein